MKAVLVDTSVWVDHFRQGSRELVGLLASGALRKPGAPLAPCLAAKPAYLFL